MSTVKVRATATLPDQPFQPDPIEWPVEQFSNRTFADVLATNAKVTVEKDDGTVIVYETLR